LQAGFIERLEDVERRKEKGSRSAGRVENRDLLDGFPDGTKQFRSFTKLNRILRELADIQIERNQIIDLVDLAGSQLSLDASIPLLAFNGFAPNLGGKRVFIGGLTVPAVALFYIGNSALISAGNGRSAPFFIASWM
jgi:hypothetical protein